MNQRTWFSETGGQRWHLFFVCTDPSPYARNPEELLPIRDADGIAPGLASVARMKNGSWDWWLWDWVFDKYKLTCWPTRGNQQSRAGAMEIVKQQLATVP